MWLPAVLWEKQALAESVVCHTREGSSCALSLRSSAGKILKKKNLKSQLKNVKEISDWQPVYTPLRMWRLSALFLSWATLWMTASGQRTPRPASAFLSQSPSTTLLLIARRLSNAGWRWSEWRWRGKSQNPLRPTAVVWTTTTCRKLTPHETNLKKTLCVNLYAVFKLGSWTKKNSAG